ncbi:MAG: OmpA family protein [Campylobacteraceae bacterium]|nr:OmpA family protein [Campylobacteraceae bacterium]MBT3882374.1 OmpA family protein [Campylobacteraceae bacterium]MBT4031258.1 OmpA family protein [Campylobacteraceae bacterium]MBT4178909.1 OmpA family protein [Campylobacteraceae bacterium]MBT4573171.1 OmpA family protein [Campylobacteraceae bacterium]
MKKLGLFSFLAAALLFTGCSQKNVGFEGQQDKGTELVTEKVIAGTEYEAVATGIDSSSTNNLKSTDFDYYNEEVTLADGTKATVKQIFFGFDKFNLTTEMLDRVKNNASVFSKLKANAKVKLEGNCDEWGTDEYNFALGLKRAKSVKDALITEGINSDRIVLVSFGESNPLCTTKTKDCWKLNRRVENKILP